MGYLLLMIVISYLMGSFPTSIIAGKLLKGIDIRQHGSGNAGATNVFRVLGWKAGSVVLFIDIMKGLIPTAMLFQLGLKGMSWDPVNMQILAGISAVFGHIWTVFAGFKGGKGVGTGAGMVIGLLPQAVVIAILVFIVTVAITRYVSLGSILASVSLPLAVFGQKFLMGIDVPIQLQLLSLFIPALIIFTHRSNVQRLLKGEESKILQKSE